MSDMKLGVPQGYKNSKVGVIPVEWEVVRLGEISKITMGQSPSSDSYNDKQIGIPLIQGNADCKNRKTLPRNYTTEKTKECFVNDIIMTVRAPVGAISKSLHNACIGRGVCAIKSKQDNEFLYHFLVNYEQKWEKYSQGSTFTAVNSSDIKSLKIPLPPLKEQQKIAEILTTWDNAISKQEELVKAKEELKKGLMQKLLSGEVRFGGFDDKWKFTKLGDLLDYIQPTKYLVANRDYDNSYKTPVLTAGKTFILGYTKEENGIFTEDLPVIIFDDFTTATKFVNFPFKAKSSAMKILKAKNKDINIKLVFEMMQILKNIAYDHKRHWISEYQEIEIKLPSLQEQQKIAQVLSNADKEIELLKDELQELKKQKKGLMQKLLTGKVRVKV